MAVCAHLAQGDIGLVREALHERGVLFRNAPHLVHAREFVVPAYRWLDLLYYGIGLKAYDWLAGRSNLAASGWIGPAEVISRIPTISRRGLRGGIVYTDGQFDDARLAITLARTLADLGGSALNAAPVTGFIKRGGRIVGVNAEDAETGEGFAIEARGDQCNRGLRRHDPQARRTGRRVKSLAHTQPGYARGTRSFVPPRNQCDPRPTDR